MNRYGSLHDVGTSQFLYAHGPSASSSAVFYGRSSNISSAPRTLKTHVALQQTLASSLGACYVPLLRRLRGSRCRANGLGVAFPGSSGGEGALPA